MGIIELFQNQKIRSIELRTEDLNLRKKRLVSIEKWIYAHRPEIQQAEYADSKKPAAEVEVTELFPLLMETRQAIRNLKRWSRPKSVRSGLVFLGTKAKVHYEPKGTCLIIAPWNYPLLLTLGPAISAIAAGNTVILKPSEFTPNVNALIGQMIQELFDPSEFAMLEGDAKVATELLELPFDHIFFTGSPAVGKIVMEAASKNLTSVTLELGGKSPTIIDETANLADAAHKIAWGKWTNAGQTCIAPDHVFVHRDQFEKFIELFKKTSEKYMYEGNFGAIINQRHYDRLMRLYNDALTNNAAVLIGGAQDSSILRIFPTVLGNVTDGMKIMEEEIFGPILPILIYDEINTVIKYINDRPKPLALYIFSRSRKNIHAIVNQTSSGGVVINDNVLQFGHPYLPMGGVGNSGLGKAHGHEGFLAFSHPKSILKQRIGFTIAQLVYPPYSEIKKKLIALMLKYF